MLVTGVRYKKNAIQKFNSYAFLLISILSLGLAGCAGVVSGSGGGSASPSPLAITNVQASAATTTGFQVGWSTNAAANSSIDYGKTASYGSTTTVDPTMVTSHQVPLTNLAIGTMYHFRVRSTDANNSNAVSGDMTFATAGDTVAPTASITSPAANATISGTVNVSVTASDNIGVKSVQLKIDNANSGAAATVAPYVISVNTNSLSNGNHILTAVASDAAGNSGTSSQVTVKVNNLNPDTTPPAVSITAPANGATVSSTISITANASDNVGVASVQFQVDGANFGGLDTTSPYSASWNTATASNGSHTVSAIAKDAAGNSTTSATVTVTVSNSSLDTTPPTVSITAPANGATVSGTVSVTANASDNVGVASVQFQVDGANLGSLDTASPYAASWDTTAASNGSHTLQAIAKDAAGNAATSAAVSVTVSNVVTPPPTGTVTSFQLSSPLTGTFPFTVGLGFKKGDIPGTAVLSVANQQVVTKSTWSDGSIKTAIASGRVALTANTAKTVNVLAGSPPSGTNITCASIQAAAPSASIQVGSIGTVSLSSLLASPFRTWASGPEMGECHYRSTVGSDATLAVWFHVRLYADGRMWVRAVAENGVLDIATADKTYAPTVIIGGVTVFNNSGASLTHYAHTRWAADGWIGGDPNITPKHDARYLEASRLVPNYMNQTPSSAKVSGLTQSYTPMQKGDWTTDMGSTGFQNQIGILPLWDALYVTSNADSRAYNSVLANAKSLNSYPIVWVDSATKVTTIPSNRPTWTVSGAGGGGATSVSAGGLNWDIAHHGSGGYLAYLITGDYYFLETMEDQASMCYLMVGSTNGSGTSRPLRGQTRAVGWCFRTLGQLAGIGGNDTVPNDYRTLLANDAAFYNNAAQQPGMNQLGYLYSFEIDTTVYSTTASVIAPWQEDFLTQSVGFISDLEPLASSANLTALRAYLYKSPVGRLGPTGSTNYCFTEAAQYNQKVADAPGASPSGYYPDWGTVWLKNFGFANTSCGNTLQTQGSTSIVANTATAYWGNMLPAISYAVDHGATGAAAAYARMTGATNWSIALNSGFGDTPIWGIVPRSGTPPPPPPPATTVSVTAPATGATVSGMTTVTASASSSSGIAGVQFQLDSVNAGAEVTTSPYSLPWNTTSTTDGTHFLAAVARDSQGNLSASNSVSVTVSNVSATNPPVLSAIVVAPSSSGALITWTTDKLANSQVEYGATSSYGSQTALDSTLVTLHAATISGLSASTTYQFRVHSTDAGGNAAVSSNLTFTTLAQSGLPTTLGWFQIPNSQLAPNCPSPNPGGACSNVIAAWGGGTADTQRNRLLIWGGGHVDYYGNEVYALDLNSLTMRRIIDPSPNPVHCVETQPDGRPSSRHTYDNLSYVAHVDKMFSFGGGLACDNPMAAVGSWTLDLATLQWKRMDPVNGGSPDPSLGYAVSDYDPVTKSVILNNGLSLWTYAYDTNTWTQRNSSQIWNGMSGAVDPVRHLFVAFGLGKARIFNIAAGGNYAMQTLDSQVTSCSGLVNAVYPGVVYDSRQNLIVGWAGGDTVYLFNPDTNSCTTKTFAGGPGAQQANGTYGRFSYFPALNVFTIVNDWQQNAYTLRLTQ